MKNNLLKIIILLFILLIISGCSDATEPDTLGYAVALGIDKSENDNSKFDITIQFANPTKISGGSSEEGGEGGQESIKNITVTAPGIYSAVNIANHIVSKTFVLSHTKLIVFSEELCRSGIDDILETVGRSGDIRPNTYFAVSKCSAKDFLEAVNPETEVNPVRYYSMIFENDYSGFVPQNLSQDFYFFSSGKEKSTVLPLCSVSEKQGTYKFSNTGYQYKLEDFSAGEIPFEKKETEVIGAAIFQKDKMVGEIGDIETELYNILTGEYRSSYVSYYYDKTSNDPVILLQKQVRKPIIHTDVSDDVPKLSIKIFLEADFISSTPEAAVEDRLDEFIDEISEEIKAEAEKFLIQTKVLGTDIIGFGSYAKRNFKDIQSFYNYNWSEKYKNSEIEVSVDFAVRRTGLVVRSDKK